jgi:methanogenic corrinoid protein MtbC1
MPDRPSSKLIRVIEGEIVPRLLVSFAGSVTPVDGPEPAAAPGIDTINEFARLLLQQEGSPAAALIEKIYPQGTAAAQICLGLMAPAARRLGELWERDECNFEELTAGLRRIESLLCEAGTRLR